MSEYAKDFVNTGSGNGVPPIQHQAINQTNADLSSIGFSGTNHNLDGNTKIFLQENAFENVVCKMETILFHCGHYIENNSQ